jgi:hypothetical protein
MALFYSQGNEVPVNPYRQIDVVSAEGRPNLPATGPLGRRPRPPTPRRSGQKPKLRHDFGTSGAFALGVLFCKRHDSISAKQDKIKAV